MSEHNTEIEYKGPLDVDLADVFMSEHNTEIKYPDCADVLLKLWMENIITNGEYYRIMDKLNKAHKDGVI